MATLTTQQVTSSGLAATANTAAGGGDKVAPGSLLRVNNGGGSPITVTLVSPEVRDGDLAVADRAVTVTNGTAKYIYASDYYRNKTTGLVDITYSAVTSVTVEVIKS